MTETVAVETKPKLDAARLRADFPVFTHKFEAGTPPIAEAFALGVAIDYLNGIGLEAIERYEQELTAYALGRLAELPCVTVLGPPPERRGGIVSFLVEGVHPPRRRPDPRLGRRGRPGPATTAPSPRSPASASRRRPARASTSTPCPQRSTASSRASTR